jgi:phosphatidylserine/phosphatidylglycerophosphate/cardiolipin synthase-like enzyme
VLGSGPDDLKLQDEASGSLKVTIPDSDHPTIYTGSPNFSKASEESNDENVLEIKGNARLAQAYVAEFMRLYNHYCARAIWNENHGSAKAAITSAARPRPGRLTTSETPLVLKTARDAWVKGAYREGTKEYLARTKGL